MLTRICNSKISTQGAFTGCVCVQNSVQFQVLSKHFPGGVLKRGEGLTSCSSSHAVRHTWKGRLLQSIRYWWFYCLKSSPSTKHSSEVLFIVPNGKDTELTEQRRCVWESTCGHESWCLGCEFKVNESTITLNKSSLSKNTHMAQLCMN